MPSNDSLRLKRARQILRSELDSYDLLSRQSKLRRTHEHEHHVYDTTEQYGPDKGYVCGHNIKLTSPCDMCKRSQQDCKEYEVALKFILTKLVSQLGVK